MAEYIYKRAVIAKIDEFAELNKSRGFPVGIFDMEMLRKRIEQIPAANLAPVKHGEWNKKPFLIGISYYCSECGDNFGEPYNYCPNCGAKMDEGKGDFIE